MPTGRSDNERREARGISDTQVHTDHGPPSVDRHSIHDERRSRKSSSVTSCSSSSTSPNHWLGYYSRHHSMPAGRLARTASAPPPSVSAADGQLSTTTSVSAADEHLSTTTSVSAADEQLSTTTSVSDADEQLSSTTSVSPADQQQSTKSSVNAADGHLSTTTTDAEDDDAQSTFRSDGSTPEPPLSARPKNLNNHPKILKDQLHNSLTSPFRPTHDVKFLNRSWTFAGR